MTLRTLFDWSTASLPSSVQADNTNYTMGNQFKVTSAATLTGVSFYSAPGSISLPRLIGLFTVSGHTLVHSETASWSGAAGSGRVRANFATPQALTANVDYKIAVLDDANSFWYSVTSHYWDTGPGASGITNGILTAPNNAGADGGQGTFFTGASITYPDTSFNAGNYWVDPEIEDGVLGISTTSLPGGTVGVPYSATLAASGGTTPYTWDISAGSLPAWASLNPSTGAITGTPTAAATTSFTVRVTDNVSATDTKALSITIDPAPGGGGGSPGTLMAGFI